MTHNVEVLEAEYRKYAEEYGAAYASGDHRATNKILAISTMRMTGYASASLMVKPSSLSNCCGEQDPA